MLLANLNCKQQGDASEDKFSTFIQANIDEYNEYHKDTSLINKVHFPQWDIYYTFKVCRDKIDIDGITEAQAKKHEAEITKMLKIWLQPLTTLTDKKLIGSEANDFVYKRLTLSEFEQLPKITADEEGAELKIIFYSKLIVENGTTDRCAGSYDTQKVNVSLITTDKDAGDLLHELGHV